MIFFAFRLLVTMIAVLLAAVYVPGLEVKDTQDALFFGFILGIINAILRPVLTFLTLPITILTLGLFSLLINAFTFWLASEISYGVRVLDFWGAFWGGMIVWASGLLSNRLIWEKDS